MFDFLKKKIKIEVPVTKYEEGSCPNCGNLGWYEGPSGGAAVNVKCAGCGLWFNNTPLGLTYIYKSTIDDTVKEIEWVYCESCKQVFGEEFFMHANGKEFPKCHHCEGFIKTCWQAKGFPIETCNKCEKRFKCYTER